MAKMTLEDLRKLREQTKSNINRRDVSENDIQIIVGTGTCGIAAGSKDVINAFIDAVEVQKLEHVTIRQTGCMGLCYVEPTVEVKVPGMPDTIYGKVDAAVAAKIVTEHILGKKLVEGHIFDRPAPDIMKK
jgi:NADP-reducing hydrogenase subunit HndB